MLVDALFGAGYHGFREGNFLSLYATLQAAIEQHLATFGNANREVLASVVDRDQLRRDIGQVFKATADALNRQVPWFDKTGNPEMLSILPSLKAMWPDAVFIFAKRRGLENVVSRLAKFPDRSFEYHCLDWARNMATWREVGPRLPDGCAIEVDQQDILRHPNHVADRLAALLTLDAAGTAAVRTTLQQNRPQQTSRDSTDRIESLATIAWTPEQIDVFTRVCGPQLEAYGYSSDDRYWR